VLARAARYARQKGRQLALDSARPSLLKIMRITGLDRAFPELLPSVHAYPALPIQARTQPGRQLGSLDRGGYCPSALSLE